MALGIVITNVNVRGSALGGAKPKIIRFTFDGAMPGGGYPLTKAQLGFDNGILLGPSGITLAGDHATWDTTNGTLLLGTAANADTLDCMVWGY